MTRIKNICITVLCLGCNSTKIHALYTNKKRYVSKNNVLLAIVQRSVVCYICR